MRVQNVSQRLNEPLENRNLLQEEPQGEKDQLRGEKDQLCEEKDQLRGEKDQLRGEKDQLRGEKDQLCGEKDQLWGEKGQRGEDRAPQDALPVMDVKLIHYYFKNLIHSWPLSPMPRVCRPKDLHNHYLNCLYLLG